MKAPTILVVDDESEIQKLLQITLSAHDYEVQVAGTGKAGLQMARSHNPDAVILDIGLPDRSGHDVLKDLRNWYGKPVIMLTVRSDEEEIVAALDAGANDYLVKPFRTGELLARIRSATRRMAGTPSTEIYDNSDLAIDFVRREVRLCDSAVKLTATEYKLLCLFACNEGRVLTHQHLLTEVWGPSFVGQTQYLRVFVGSLRKKIEADPNRPRYILTESGVGYRFVNPDQKG